MLSTPEGQRQLLSKTGYEHLSLREIEEYARSGCALCTLVYSDVTNKDLTEKTKPLVVFVESDGDRLQASQDPQSPFEGLIIDRLSWRLAPSPSGLLKAQLSVSADPGETVEIQGEASHWTDLVDVFS